MSSATLTQGSVPKHLYRMTLPVIWGLLANFSMQFVDMWFISQLGEDALTAIGFTFPVIMLVLSLSIGLSAGMASVVARKAGHYTRHELQQLVSDNQLLCLLLSIIVAVAGLLTIDPLFRLLGASDAVLPLIRQYMEIFYLQSILLLLTMQAVSAVRAMGDSRVQAYSMLSAAAINAILDPILIFGLFGAPRLEIQGAALASAIARLVAMAIAYYVLIYRWHLLKIPTWCWARIKRSWFDVLHISLPAAGTNMIIPLSGAIITALLASFGPYAVAGMGIAIRIEPMLLICFFSLSAIISPFAGQNFGAKLLPRVYQGVYYACGFSVVLALIIAALIFIFSTNIVGLFTKDADIANVAINYLRIVPISYGAAAVIMIVNASFNGIGKPLAATAISVLRVVVLYLPLAYLGSYYWGIKGIFMAYTAVNIISAIIAIVWFHRLAKKCLHKA